jgi:hypothetical protein
MVDITGREEKLQAIKEIAKLASKDIEDIKPLICLLESLYEEGKHYSNMWEVLGLIQDVKEEME